MATPKLRFKEFEGDWVQSKLGTQAQFLQGEQVSLDDQYNEYTDGLTKFLRIENFTQKSKDFRYIKYIGSKEKLLNEQDIAIVRYGATAGFICSGETGVIANNLFKVIVDNKKINQKYLELVLKSEKTFNYFQSEMAGGAMPALNFKIVSNLDITYSSLEEQTKIASFLSAVDEKINQLTQKHALLSQYKQGMMQKLFSQQLRFKADDGSEFGEWEERLLSEIGSFKNGLNKDKESFGFGFPFVNLMDVFGKNIIQIDNLGLVDANQKDLENYDLKKGDVLFIRSSVKAEGVGQTALVLNDLDNTVYSGFLIRFRDTYGLDLGFKKYCFMNNEFRLKLLAKSTTSANTNINQESLSALSIKVPCLEEQFKIANFLSAIDQKIEVVAQQIEQAKTWKKGLLQQMFV